MRVTDGMMARRVSRSLNTASNNLNRLSNQVVSGMKASKTSEDTAGAMKAFKVRRELSRNIQTQNSVTELKGQLEQTETTITAIKDVLAQAKESLTQGINGTLSDSDRSVMANIFRNMQNEILQLANTNYAGKYILGGPNTTTKPFTLDASGNLLYNGQNVNNSTISTEVVYTTINHSAQFDASGNLDLSSVIALSTPGSVVLGYGTDANGHSRNVYNLLGEIATAIENGDKASYQSLMDSLSDRFDETLVQITDVGERIKFVEFIDERAKTDAINLKSKQKAVEGIDTAEALIDYKVSEMAYNAALQMGAKVIQSSLLDYLK